MYGGRKKRVLKSFTKSAHASAAQLSDSLSPSPTDEHAVLLRSSDAPEPAAESSSSFCSSCVSRCCGDSIELLPRTIAFDGERVTPASAAQNFPPNIVRNQQYSLLSFVPVVLFNQFRFFFNLYFLLVALTQFIPVLQVGFLFTYIAPLGFVLSITMIKEAVDDFARYQRTTLAFRVSEHVISTHLFC